MHNQVVGRIIDVLAHIVGIVGEHELCGCLLVAQVEARGGDGALLDVGRANHALVALQGIDGVAPAVDARAAQLPSGWRELRALEEFELVAVGHSHLGRLDVQRHVAAIGLDDQVGLDRAGQRGLVADLEPCRLVHTQVDVLGVHHQAEGVGAFKAGDLEALEAHILEREHLTVELLADVGGGEAVGGLRELGDGAGLGHVLLDAHVVKIHHIAALLEQVVDKGHLDGLALPGREVNLGGLHSPVGPQVVAERVGGHTTVAHLLLVGDVKDYRRVAGSDINDAHLEGVLLLLEHPVGSGLPVERQLVGVVEQHSRREQHLGAWPERVLVVGVGIGRGIAHGILVPAHGRAAGAVLHRPLISQVGPRILLDHFPSGWELTGRSIPRHILKPLVNQGLGAGSQCHRHQQCHE